MENRPFGSERLCCLNTAGNGMDGKKVGWYFLYIAGSIPDREVWLSDLLSQTRIIFYGRSSVWMFAQQLVRHQMLHFADADVLFAAIENDLGHHRVSNFQLWCEIAYQAQTNVCRYPYRCANHKLKYIIYIHIMYACVSPKPATCIPHFVYVEHTKTLENPYVIILKPTSYAPRRSLV